jgi:hypothetical protein
MYHQALHLERASQGGIYARDCSISAE